MSFRKKTRPVIALSSLSRSRQFKGSESDESRGSNTEKASKTGNNAITTCANSKGGKDLKDHLEEVASPKSTNKIEKTDNEGSKINYDGPLKTIQSKRFKRFRPAVSNSSRAKQLALKDDEEPALQLKEESSSCFGDDVEKINVLDIECDHPTTSKEEGSDSRFTTDFGCTKDYPILVDNLSKLDSNVHSFIANVDTEQVHNAGCSLPSNSSCSAMIHSDLNESQTGFAVAASSISNKESREEEIKHQNTFSTAKESESDLKPIPGPPTELSHINSKPFSPSNWTTKRKISPCLSRAGRKSDSKIDAKFRKPDEINKNDRIGILEKGHGCREDFVNGTLFTKAEPSDKHSRLPDPGVAKLQESSSSLSEYVANTKFLDVSSSIKCEIKDRLLTNPVKEDLNVDATATDGDSSSSNVTNLDASIANNKTVCGKSDKSELEIKKSKRVRFKPNIVAKCSRSSPKSSGCSSSIKNELSVPLEWPNEGKLSPSLENCDVEHKQTPFAQQAIQNGALVTECGKIESCPPIENEHKGTLLRNSYQNTTNLGRHSDTEDGSQSEGEGIQHHKRKFTPYLGPKVRQRRRSVTLFEDDGHMSDKNQKDSNPEVFYFLVFILSFLHC